MEKLKIYCCNENKKNCRNTPKLDQVNKRKWINTRNARSALTHSLLRAWRFLLLNVGTRFISGLLFKLSLFNLAMTKFAQLHRIQRSSRKYNLPAVSHKLADPPILEASATPTSSAADASSDIASTLPSTIHAAVKRNARARICG